MRGLSDKVGSVGYITRLSHMLLASDHLNIEFFYSFRSRADSRLQPELEIRFRTDDVRYADASTVLLMS